MHVLFNTTTMNEGQLFSISSTPLSPLHPPLYTHTKGEGAKLFCPRALPLADQLNPVWTAMVTRGAKEAQLDVLLLFPQSFQISDLQSKATNNAALFAQLGKPDQDFRNFRAVARRFFTNVSVRSLISSNHDSFGVQKWW